MTRATSKSASVKVCGNKEHPTVEQAGGSSVLHAAALSPTRPEEPSRSPPAPTSSPGSFQAGAPLSVMWPPGEGARGRRDTWVCTAEAPAVHPKLSQHR